VARPANTAGAVRGGVQECAYACASHIVACGDERFTGALRIEFDRAFGSGPRATVLRDLLSALL